MTTEESTGSVRRQVLEEAAEIVDGDRDNQYGSPEDNFGRIAGALSALGYRGPDGREIIPSDVAVILIATKIGRLSNTHGKRDTWVDIAGYAACGAEIVQRHEPKATPVTKESVPEDTGTTSRDTACEPNRSGVETITEAVRRGQAELATLGTSARQFTPFATTPAGDIPAAAVVRRVPGGPARGLTPGALYLNDHATFGVWVDSSRRPYRITPSAQWFSISVWPIAVDIVSPVVEIDPTKIPFFPVTRCSRPHTLSDAEPHLHVARHYLWLCPGEAESED
jgi:hypothetical protein